MKVKNIRVLFLSVLAAQLALLAWSPAVHAGEVKGLREWTGQVEDAKLEKEWPNASPLTSKDDFAKLWKSWAPQKEVPQVDFDKEWVLVYTQKKGQIYEAALFGQKGGDFVSTASIEAKPVKGYTYAFTVFKRQGIKSVNGMPVK